MRFFIEKVAFPTPFKFHCCYIESVNFESRNIDASDKLIFLKKRKVREGREERMRGGGRKQFKCRCYDTIFQMQIISMQSMRLQSIYGELKQD